MAKIGKAAKTLKGSMRGGVPVHRVKVTRVGQLPKGRQSGPNAGTALRSNAVKATFGSRRGSSKFGS